MQKIFLLSLILSLTLPAKKVLIVGSGGREHALAWKLAQSPQVETIFVAPGNAGTAREIKTCNVPIDATNINGLASFAQRNSIDLTIVGPEVPLALGIVDLFEQKGFLCCGPKKAAAQIEASKDFAKEFMIRHNIPTARYQSFIDAKQAKEYARLQDLPLVIKADGLAAGKGVVIANTYEQVEQTIGEMLTQKKFGRASQKIIIEEFIQGRELSFIVLTDGTTIFPFETSQDYKKLLPGDKGPNTGGMGAISPSPLITKELHNRIMQEIIEPTIQGLKKEDKKYTGFLYAGLMITPQGDPKVLEFNCRLGDPETQVLLLRLDTDLYCLLESCCLKKLDAMNIAWSLKPAVGVVITASGYPYKSTVGDIITGLEGKRRRHPGQYCNIFHAGTAFQGFKYVTNGGRIACIGICADTFEQARNAVYDRIATIFFPDMFYRVDIGDVKKLDF